MPTEKEKQNIAVAMRILADNWNPSFCLVIDPQKPKQIILGIVEQAATMDCGRVPVADWSGQTLEPSCYVATFAIPTQIGTFAEQKK